MGLEPMIFCMASRCFTTKLLPHYLLFTPQFGQKLGSRSPLVSVKSTSNWQLQLSHSQTVKWFSTESMNVSILSATFQMFWSGLKILIDFCIPFYYIAGMRKIYRVYPPQVTRRCDWCDQLFQPLMRDVMEGNGRFCSRSCCNTYRSKILRTKIKAKPRKKTALMTILSCATCNILFDRALSSLNESKSKIYFCSRKCKDKASRLESDISIKPSHYRTGEDNYRQIAFRHHPKKCNRCDYDKIVDILHVHHKDRNHKNNRPDNLEVLCPTCHDEEHFLAKDGRYATRLDKPFIYTNSGAADRLCPDTKSLEDSHATVNTTAAYPS